MTLSLRLAQCPVIPKAAPDAPLGSATYARMFAELPSFESDEEFLHALGRLGGACDRGDIDDSPESLAETAALVGLIDADATSFRRQRQERDRVKHSVSYLRHEITF